MMSQANGITGLLHGEFIKVTITQFNSYCGMRKICVENPVIILGNRYYLLRKNQILMTKYQSVPERHCNKCSLNCTSKNKVGYG